MIEFLKIIIFQFIKNWVQLDFQNLKNYNFLFKIFNYTLNLQKKLGNRFYIIFNELNLKKLSFFLKISSCFKVFTVKFVKWKFIKDINKYVLFKRKNFRIIYKYRLKISLKVETMITVVFFKKIFMFHSI